MIGNFSQEEEYLLSNYSDVELIEFADRLNNYILQNYSEALALGKIISPKDKVLAWITSPKYRAKVRMRKEQIASGELDKRLAKIQERLEQRMDSPTNPVRIGKGIFGEKKEIPAFENRWYDVISLRQQLPGTTF